MNPNNNHHILEDGVGNKKNNIKKEDHELQPGYVRQPNSSDSPTVQYQHQLQLLVSPTPISRRQSHSSGQQPLQNVVKDNNNNNNTNDDNDAGEYDQQEEYERVVLSTLENSAEDSFAARKRAQQYYRQLNHIEDDHIDDDEGFAIHHHVDRRMHETNHHHHQMVTTENPNSQQQPDGHVDYSSRIRFLRDDAGDDNNQQIDSYDQDEEEDEQVNGGGHSSTGGESLLGIHFIPFDENARLVTSLGKTDRSSSNDDNNINNNDVVPVLNGSVGTDNVADDDKKDKDQSKKHRDDEDGKRTATFSDVASQYFDKHSETSVISQISGGGIHQVAARKRSTNSNKKKFSSSSIGLAALDANGCGGVNRIYIKVNNNSNNEQEEQDSQKKSVVLDTTTGQVISVDLNGTTGSSSAISSPKSTFFRSRTSEYFDGLLDSNDEEEDEDEEEIDSAARELGGEDSSVIVNKSNNNIINNSNNAETNDANNNKDKDKNPENKKSGTKSLNQQRTTKPTATTAACDQELIKKKTTKQKQRKLEQYQLMKYHEVTSWLTPNPRLKSGAVMPPHTKESNNNNKNNNENNSNTKNGNNHDVAEKNDSAVDNNNNDKEQQNADLILINPTCWTRKLLYFFVFSLLDENDDYGTGIRKLVFAYCLLLIAFFPVSVYWLVIGLYPDRNLLVEEGVLSSTEGGQSVIAQFVMGIVGLFFGLFGSWLYIKLNATHAAPVWLSLWWTICLVVSTLASAIFVPATPASTMCTAIAFLLPMQLNEASRTWLFVCGVATSFVYLVAQFNITFIGTANGDSLVLRISDWEPHVGHPAQIFVQVIGSPAIIAIFVIPPWYMFVNAKAQANRHVPADRLLLRLCFQSLGNLDFKAVNELLRFFGSPLSEQQKQLEKIQAIDQKIKNNINNDNNNNDNNNCRHDDHNKILPHSSSLSSSTTLVENTTEPSSSFFDIMRSIASTLRTATQLGPNKILNKLRSSYSITDIRDLPLQMRSRVAVLHIKIINYEDFLEQVVTATGTFDVMIDELVNKLRQQRNHGNNNNNNSNNNQSENDDNGNNSTQRHSSSTSTSAAFSQDDASQIRLLKKQRRHLQALYNLIISLYTDTIMSRIERHGGTIIENDSGGEHIVACWGCFPCSDPSLLACCCALHLRHVVDTELAPEFSRTLANVFHLCVSMGISTGFAEVGNLGSTPRESFPFFTATAHHQMDNNNHNHNNSSVDIDEVDEDATSFEDDDNSTRSHLPASSSTDIMKALFSKNSVNTLKRRKESERAIREYEATNKFFGANNNNHSSESDSASKKTTSNFARQQFSVIGAPVVVAKGLSYMYSVYFPSSTGNNSSSNNNKSNIFVCEETMAQARGHCKLARKKAPSSSSSPPRLRQFFDSARRPNLRFLLAARYLGTACFPPFSFNFGMYLLVGVASPLVDECTFVEAAAAAHHHHIINKTNYNNIVVGAASGNSRRDCLHYNNHHDENYEQPPDVAVVVDSNDVYSSQQKQQHQQRDETTQSYRKLRHNMFKDEFSGEKRDERREENKAHHHRRNSALPPYVISKDTSPATYSAISGNCGSGGGRGCGNGEVNQHGEDEEGSPVVLFVMNSTTGGSSYSNNSAPPSVLKNEDSLSNNVSPSYCLNDDESNHAASHQHHHHQAKPSAMALNVDYGHHHEAAHATASTLTNKNLTSVAATAAYSSATTTSKKHHHESKNKKEKNNNDDEFEESGGTLEDVLAHKPSAWKEPSAAKDSDKNTNNSDESMKKKHSPSMREWNKIMKQKIVDGVFVDDNDDDTDPNRASEEDQLHQTILYASILFCRKHVQLDALATETLMHINKGVMMIENRIPSSSKFSAKTEFGKVLNALDPAWATLLTNAGLTFANAQQLYEIVCNELFTVQPMTRDLSSYI